MARTDLRNERRSISRTALTSGESDRGGNVGTEPSVEGAGLLSVGAVWETMSSVVTKVRLGLLSLETKEDKEAVEESG